MTIDAATTPARSSAGAVATRSRSSSEPMPVRCVQSVAIAPATAVNAMPNSVPNRAEVVRIETPWARYSTASMMIVEPATATAIAGRPASRAGSTNCRSTSSVIPMPTRAKTPRHRATIATSTAKTPAIQAIGTLRWWS